MFRWFDIKKMFATLKQLYNIEIEFEQPSQVQFSPDDDKFDKINKQRIVSGIDTRVLPVFVYDKSAKNVVNDMANLRAMRTRKIQEISHAGKSQLRLN